jgi:hypothetical protein
MRIRSPRPRRSRSKPSPVFRNLRRGSCLVGDFSRCECAVDRGARTFGSVSNCPSGCRHRTVRRRHADSDFGVVGSPIDLSANVSETILSGGAIFNDFDPILGRARSETKRRPSAHPPTGVNGSRRSNDLGDDADRLRSPRLRGPHATATLRLVMDLLQSVDRRRDALEARLQLQRQELGIMARLVQIAAVEP